MCSGFAGFCLILIIFCVPETYAPQLMVVKATRLRKETGDDRWYAQRECFRLGIHCRANCQSSGSTRRSRSESRTSSSSPSSCWVSPTNRALTDIPAQEPMLLAVTLYMSFVYGVVYLLFEAYPFVFVYNHGFNSGENGLAFLGFFTGGFLCVIL